tara:strand:+ start:481 stop:954 length:474 start_codon:yes stop_codon:yes gene_type:complete
MGVLTVSIKEELSLNGTQQGGMNTLSIANVNQFFKRIVTCPSGSDTTVASFQASTSTVAGKPSFSIDDVKYVRVTNLDSTNSVNLSLQVSTAENGTADSSCTILLQPGRSFISGKVHDGIAVDDDQKNIVTSLTDLESLLVDPGSSSVKVEVFIVST